MPDDNKNLDNSKSDAGAKDNNGTNNADDNKKDEGKKDDSNGNDNGQDQGGKKNDADETITIKKADWEKTNKDLDNYRTGLINKKAADRSLDQLGSSDSGNVNTSTVLDEKKVMEIATKASQATTHKTNEKAAIKILIKEINL